MQFRLRLFKIAVQIYAVCVDMNTAEFPINVEFRIYLRLCDVFGQAAKHVGLPICCNLHRDPGHRTVTNAKGLGLRTSEEGLPEQPWQPANARDQGLICIAL